MKEMKWLRGLVLFAGVIGGTGCRILCRWSFLR
jgi:hypothetical protein